MRTYRIFSRGMTIRFSCQTTLAGTRRWSEGRGDLGQAGNIGGYFSAPGEKIKGLINRVQVVGRKSNGYLGGKLIVY